MNRRSFLQSAAAAGSLAAFSIKSSGAEKSGRKYRTALVGCGWWGGNILGETLASRQCEVVDLSDVDDRQIASIVEKISKVTGDQPRKYRYYRALLAKKKPGIVIVVTPDHYHALPTIAEVKVLPTF